MADESAGEAATNALAPERNYETEAADMGWTPKEQWKGNPDNWKDAKTYVEHGEDIVRVTKAQLKAQEKSFEERIKRMEGVNTKTIERLQKQFDKDLAEAKEAKKAAVKAGNVEEVERLDGVIDDLKEDAKPDKKLTGAALDKHNQKVQEDWTAGHAWWGVDEDMTAWAIGKSQSFAAKDPEISIEDNLSKLDEALKKKYPEQFGGAKLTEANAHAPVDGGGSFPNGKGGDPLSKLPPEARAQAKSDMAKYPKIYKTAGDWIAAYEGKN